MLGSCWHPWAPGGLERQLEGGQAAPPWVLGQAMQSRAAVRCWRCLRPPPDASLDRRPTRPPLVGGSWHLQPAPEAQKKEAPLMLLFLQSARGRRASEPPTYMVDDLRGQELPSGALRPPPARPACPRAQTAPRWPPLGEGRTRTSGSYASHTAAGDTLSRVDSAS